MITLRPYQREALEAIAQAAARGLRRLLLALPTGTGKTVIFSELIAQRGGRALILVHRDELLEQAIAKLRTVAPGVPIGVVKAERDDVDAAIVVASVQTLSRGKRLGRVRADFTTLVIDECHHATADSYRCILDHVGAFRPNGPLTLGCSATPERADGASLGDVFQTIVYRKSLFEMIEAGFLADLRAIRVHLDVDFDRVHTRAGDLATDELDEALRDADAPQHALEAYRSHADGRKTLIFTPTVASAHEMAAAFAAAGLAAEALDGGTDPIVRRAMLARLHTGETRIVANCAVLTEGFDEPSISCVIIARPTKSRPLYTQMIGRGSRVYPGKDDCLILDLVGSTTRHDLVTAATLFHLPPTALDEDVPVTQAVAAQRVADQARDDEGRLVATTVKLFQRRPLHWIVADATHYVLSLGDGGLLMLSSADHQQWIVEHIDRDHVRHPLATGLDLGFAQGTAEDYARKLGAGALVEGDAAWRRAPATEKQRIALRRWRIHAPPGLTKGEASDLIVAATARVA